MSSFAPFPLRGAAGHRSPKRRAHRARLAPLLSVLFAVSCSGNIGEIEDSSGSRPRTTGGAQPTGTGGAGGAGTTTGGGATTGGSTTTGGTTTGGGATTGGTTTGGGGATTGGAGGSTGGAGGGAGTPMGPINSRPSASSRFVRLNHQQWENSVRDVLKLPASLGLSNAFVAEPLRSTFDTNGSLLSVSPDLWKDYQTAAETVGNKIARDPALLASVAPPMPADTAGRSKAFIEKIGARAFRRPLTPAEVSRFVTQFDKGSTLIGSGDAFADGVEVVLAAFFQSANFLYRVELSTTVANGNVPLTDYEIASRMSYGLTNTIPDDALFTAAGAKKLVTRDGVIEQAKRLLATPAAENAVSSFHDQLFRMREFDGIKKDEKLYPYFGAGVGADLKTEALTFVKDVVFSQDRGLSELLTAPYTFANARIGQIYGITVTPPGGQANAFVRVALDPTQRAGLLTQAGFLAANGEQQTPNIIMRGVHIAKDVLCVDVPPPPDAVPPLPAIPPNSTNRQRVENLTKDAPCNGCHATMINPLGFAFENLDGVGKFRTQENAQAINASATYNLDGMATSFNGAVPLIQAIAASKQAHDCYARHWVEYLYGRDVDVASAADQDLITQAGAMSKGNTSVKNLIVNLVATDAFLTRLP
jgi:hypothetical protein